MMTKLKKEKPKTDWDYLSKVSPKTIRRALESDPDIHPTDAAFWKSAKVVKPRLK